MVNGQWSKTYLISPTFDSIRVFTMILYSRTARYVRLAIGKLMQCSYLRKVSVEIISGEGVEITRSIFHLWKVSIAVELF